MRCRLTLPLVRRTDEQIREFLHDADELLVLRPVMVSKSSGA